MSLKSILHSIGGFFASIWKGMTPTLKTAVHIGVQVTNAIKDYDAAHPETADILTAIIPGDADDKIKDDLRAALPKIAVELKLVDATMGLTDPNEIMKAAVGFIQQLSGDYRTLFLNSLSIVVARVAADGKLNLDDAVYLLKWYYDHKNNIDPAS